MTARTPAQVATELGFSRAQVYAMPFAATEPAPMMFATFRPKDDYHEDMGPVLWFVHEDGAAPHAYAGSPNCSDWPFCDDEIAMFTDLPCYVELLRATKAEYARQCALTELEALG